MTHFIVSSWKPIKLIYYPMKRIFSTLVLFTVIGLASSSCSDDSDFEELQLQTQESTFDPGDGGGGGEGEGGDGGNNPPPSGD